MIKAALPFGAGTPENKRGNYRNALLDAGIEPVENVRTLDGLSGLLLAGGTDIDPALYGAERHPEADEPDRERDTLEIGLLKEALERDLPVFGICRGLQILNVALGGTLVQHIEGHKHRKQREVHPVTITPGAELYAILGVERYMVNSLHHQAVDKLAPGLIATAMTPDGIIEGVEVPGKRFATAVQWHPEARTDGPDSKLFAAFRDAMAARER